jgi:hypothetical protein
MAEVDVELLLEMDNGDGGCSSIKPAVWEFDGANLLKKLDAHAFPFWVNESGETACIGSPPPCLSWAAPPPTIDEIVAAIADRKFGSVAMALVRDSVKDC